MTDNKLTEGSRRVYCGNVACDFCRDHFGKLPPRARAQEDESK